MKEKHITGEIHIGNPYILYSYHSSSKCTIKKGLLNISCLILSIFIVAVIALSHLVVCELGLYTSLLHNKFHFKSYGENLDSNKGVTSIASARCGRAFMIWAEKAKRDQYRKEKRATTASTILERAKTKK